MKKRLLIYVISNFMRWNKNVVQQSHKFNFLDQGWLMNSSSSVPLTLLFHSQSCKLWKSENNSGTVLCSIEALWVLSYLTEIQHTTADYGSWMAQGEKKGGKAQCLSKLYSMSHEQRTNLVRRDPERFSFNAPAHTRQKKKYTRIITVQHLPINPFPDAFSLSHPCLHNESVAMATVA